MAETWQSYANVVGGLTRTVRERAVTTTRALLAQVGLEEVVVDTGERMARLAEEIGNASRANRELLENLIVAEVDRAASRLGFVRADDLEDLRAEVAELRAEVRVAAKARYGQPAGARPEGGHEEGRRISRGGRMTEPAADDGALPQTGDAEIDRALGELTDLPSTPLASTTTGWLQVHEVLHRALDRPTSPVRPEARSCPSPLPMRPFRPLWEAYVHVIPAAILTLQVGYRYWKSRAREVQ